MAKTPRKQLKPSVQSELLVATRRRCCLCVYLKYDNSQKRVQIAHIDHDCSNSSESNLVPLCLDHHDEYDSSTRLSKGITAQELKAYKQKLLDEVAKQQVDFGPAPIAPQAVETDDEHRAFKYGLLYADISRIVAEYDPVGFIDGTNIDEYDFEIDDIIFLLRQSNEKNHAEELRYVFTHWFAKDIADQFTRYGELAHDIRNAISMNEKRIGIYNPVDHK